MQDLGIRKPYAVPPNEVICEHPLHSHNLYACMSFYQMSSDDGRKKWTSVDISYVAQIISSMIREFRKLRAQRLQTVQEVHNES